MCLCVFKGQTVSYRSGRMWRVPAGCRAGRGWEPGAVPCIPDPRPERELHKSHTWNRGKLLCAAVGGGAGAGLAQGYIETGAGRSGGAAPMM